MEAKVIKVKIGTGMGPMSGMENMDGELETEDPKYGKFDEYEIEHAAEVLKEAEQIKADPEKMKYVKMCMEHEMEEMKTAMSSISSIEDLKTVRQKKVSKAY